MAENTTTDYHVQIDLYDLIADTPDTVDGCYDKSMLHKPHSLCFSIIMLSLLFQEVLSLICLLGVDCNSSL